ncbi:MAG: glycoside hydrolase family 6 protein [Pseudomonadota bacterium]
MFKKIAYTGIAALILTSAGMASAASTCSVSYLTRNDWGTGYVADLVLTNSGGGAVSNWSVSLNYPAPVWAANAPWGASYAFNGNNVTIKDNGSHPTISAGGSVSFGMVVGFSGNKTQPNVTVTGDGCNEPANPPNPPNPPDPDNPATPATGLYIDPDSNAARWVNANPSDSRRADIAAQIVNQPSARWFGNWSGEIGGAVNSYVAGAAARNQTPVLVAYNIVGRDCGQYSSGGAGSSGAYQDWIRAFAAAIGKRQAVVILEPDALPQLDCLSAANQSDRLNLIRYAVAQFKQTGAALYLDIGNSTWLAPAEAAKRLNNGGIADAHGFSLNVSNYRTDAESNAYGAAVSASLQQQFGYTRPFVVDTSRNGNGPLGTEWCDPAGRKIGKKPTRNGAGAQPEMTLWIKSPGEADGCAAAAGVFSPDLAYKLIRGY